MMSNKDLNYEWIENQINKHRETFDPEHVRHFVDLYLVNESSTDNEVFCPDQLRRIILDLFVGGTDSTANFLRWLLLRMIWFPELQRRCQKEVDLVVGSRNPELSDSPNMPFIEAVIHESFRYNVGRHLIPPHAAEHDITIHGYKIPKGTAVFSMSTLFTWTPPTGISLNCLTQVAGSEQMVNSVKVTPSLCSELGLGRALGNPWQGVSYFFF